jgi:lysophospholipase L1-like esterase
VHVVATTLTPARRICRAGPLSPNSTSTKKNVLIIGDSVSLGAFDPKRGNLPSYFQNIATLEHAPWSDDGGALDSKYAMDTTVRMKGAGIGPPWLPGADIPPRYGDGCLNGTFLSSATQEPTKYDLISFNFGIHDVDYGGARDNDAYQEEWVPLKTYESNIRAIKKTLQATNAIVVFQASTPVPYNLTTNQRILDYNAAAKAVMAEEPAASYNDLYGTIVAICGNPPYNAPNYPKSPRCSISDYNGVHYQEAGWELLANATAKAIKALLSGEQQNTAAIFEKPSRSAPAKGESIVQCNATALFAAARAMHETDGNATAPAAVLVTGHSFDKKPWVLNRSTVNGSTTGSPPITPALPTACPPNSTCMVTAFSSTGLGCW